MIKKVFKIVFYFVIGAFFFTSCGTKKTITEYRDKIVRDTIIKNVTKMVTKQINDTITIKQPCDSLGNLKNFERIIKNDKAKVKVSNNKGKLQVEVNIDSLVNSRVEQFKSNYKVDTIIKEKEVVRNRIPFWVWITLGISLILNAIFIKKEFTF